MIPNFKRKNIRLAPEYYQGRRVYFVTLCFDRRCLFGADAVLVRWLLQRLRHHADREQFFVHAYCVMPDHFHLLAEGAQENSDLLRFVNSFKQDTAFQFKRRRKQRLWQFKYYDHILRNAEHADRVAWYIWLNPVRKRLCITPGEYPYSGSFTDFGSVLRQAQPQMEWSPPWKAPMPR